MKDGEENIKSKQNILCKFLRADKHSCRSDDSHGKADNAILLLMLLALVVMMNLV